MRPNRGAAHHADVRVLFKDTADDLELLLQVVLPHIPKLDVHVLERAHDLRDRLLGPFRLRRGRCSVGLRRARQLVRHRSRAYLYVGGMLSRWGACSSIGPGVHSAQRRKLTL